jgi:hypothetical protein
LGHSYCIAKRLVSRIDALPAFTVLGVAPASWLPLHYYRVSADDNDDDGNPDSHAESKISKWRIPCHSGCADE